MVEPQPVAGLAGELGEWPPAVARRGGDLPVVDDLSRAARNERRPVDVVAEVIENAFVGVAPPGSLEIQPCLVVSKTV